MSGNSPREPVQNSSSKQRRQRNVSALTKEQVQHKRCVDRRAQRAFRQRTKDCITNLEQQFAKLQEICNQKDRELQLAHEQNTNLIKCLENVVSCASSALMPLGRSAPQRSSTIPDEHHGPPHPDLECLVDAAVRLSSHNTPQGSLKSSSALIATIGQGSPRVPSQVATSFDLQTPPMPAVMNLLSSRESESLHSHPVDTVDHSSHPMLSSSPASSRSMSSPSSSSYPQAPLTLERSLDLSLQPGEGVGLDHSLQADCLVSLPTPCSTMIMSTRNENAIFTVMPPHLAPTCPLDQILVDFRNSRRELISKGAACETILGPRKPTVKALIDTNLVESVHPLSGIMSRVLSTFPFVGMTEKFAFFYLMCLTIRWQIDPSRDNYTAMPSWLRPTAIQITLPHAAWIDNIPWPGVRDLLIENPEEYPFQIFSEYYSQNVSVNWSFDAMDAISDINDGGVLHSIFERHLRNLKNWTVSKEFQARFPAMTAAIYDRG